MTVVTIDVPDGDIAVLIPNANGVCLVCAHSYFDHYFQPLGSNTVCIPEDQYTCECAGYTWEQDEEDSDD